MRALRFMRIVFVFFTIGLPFVFHMLIHRAAHHAAELLEKISDFMDPAPCFREPSINWPSWYRNSVSFLSGIEDPEGKQK